MIYFKTLVLYIIIGSFTCTFAQDSWIKTLPGIGTFSSPRVADLNRDGIGDVILGAGRHEFMASDSAVLALNGKNGNLLWNVHANDQMFGSAIFKDINNDDVLDVFIGGRSAELIAIDGESGSIIWRFIVPPLQKKEWYNFYNPQFIPDQNNNGFEDILVSNGGDVKVAPYDPKRPAGYLVILDGKDGNIISRARMPDDKETYMSVSVLPSNSKTYKNVVYGTGGETIGGSLYVTSLDEILNGDLMNSIKLDSSETKGFIGPAAWVDITNDDNPDIVTNAVDGRLLAFDGLTYKKIWSTTIPNAEAYGSVAIGNFTKDSIPDFFVSYAKGVWPNLEWSKQIMVNGRNGAIEFEEDIGYYQTSTPVVADLNNDGKDDVIMSMNFQVIDSLKQKYYHTNMAVIDFDKKETVILELDYPGHNVSSTPWIGDIDNNGYIDIIFVHGTNSNVIYNFDGMQINRIDSKGLVRGEIKWGSYMGSKYNGVFEN